MKLGRLNALATWCAEESLRKDAGPFAIGGIKSAGIRPDRGWPFTGSLLADLGADVVKVERPDGGDGMRDWPPLSGESDRVFGGNFASLNRNKRSITADLKNPEDIARLRKLCARADVLIENFRAGVLARLGLVALSARKDIVSTSSRGRSSAFVMCCLSAARWRFVLCAPRVIREES